MNAENPVQKMLLFASTNVTKMRIVSQIVEVGKSRAYIIVHVMKDVLIQVKDVSRRSKINAKVFGETKLWSASRISLKSSMIASLIAVASRFAKINVMNNGVTVPNHALATPNALTDVPVPQKMSSEIVIVRMLLKPIPSA